MPLPQPTQRVLLALALTLLPVVAHAESGVIRPAQAVTPTDPEEAWADRRGTWYGSQTLGTDALSVLAFGASLGSGSVGLAVASLGGFVLGAPIVHMVHENPGTAGLSLVMRVGLPVFGAWLGTKAEHCGTGESYCGVGGGILGGVLGIVAASVVDAKFLAYEPKDAALNVPKSTKSAPVLPSFAFGVQSNQMTLSLGGRF